MQSQRSTQPGQSMYTGKRPDRPTCPYPFCDDTDPGHIDHTRTVYVEATRGHQKNVTIGAGVWTDDARPEQVDVSIHVCDQRQIDVQVDMTIDEAKQLFVNLHEAIDNAVAAEAVAHV